jgi:hypothetical protein
MVSLDSRNKRPPGRARSQNNRIAGHRGSATACTCEQLESRQFLSVAPGITPDQSSTLIVTVGPKNARFAQFVDAEGNTDIFSLKGPGTATVSLFGSDLAANPAKGGGQQVGGTGIGVTSISITGTNRHTSVLFTLAKHTRAAAPLPVGSLSADGAVGALSGNIDITGALTIGGTLGKVAVSGLDGGSVPTSFTASSIGSLTDLGNLGESISVSGAIGKTVIRGNVTGSISGALITSLTVGGSITGSTITLGQPLISKHSDLGKLTVAGNFAASTLNAAGNIGPIAVGALSDSTIDAGGVSLPSSFISEATISSVKAGSTAGTSIEAFTVGKVALGSVQTANNGVPFGVAGATIAQVTGIAGINGRKFNLKKLNNQALVSADLAKLGITGVDFTITIL